jgi:hypothetical protein
MCIYKNLLVYSNIFFIISFLYLLFNKKKFESFLILFIGIISSLYHTYETHHLYLLDMIVAFFIFLYLYHKYKECFYYIPLFLLLLYYFITYFSYYYDVKIYALMHSVWHILVCIYCVYIIMQK